MSRSYPKKLTTFRLSETARFHLENSVSLRQALDAFDGQEWMASKRNVTNILHEAIDYYFSHVSKLVKEREEAIAKAKADAVELLDGQRRKAGVRDRDVTTKVTSRSATKKTGVP